MWGETKMVFEILFMALLSVGVMFSAVSLIYCATQLGKEIYINMKHIL